MSILHNFFIPITANLMKAVINIAVIIAWIISANPKRRLAFISLMLLSILGRLIIINPTKTNISFFVILNFIVHHPQAQGSQAQDSQEEGHKDHKGLSFNHPI